MDGQSPFETLKAGSGALWSAAQDHPFVHGLADGSLEREKFIYFLRQDYVYLVAYSRAVLLAAAKAPGLTLMGEFTALAHETLNTEMALHREYCAQFSVSAEDLEQTTASPVCQAYSDFCIAAASSSDCAGLLAALIPCGVGYAEIGERLLTKVQQAPDHPYRRWIETYASAEFRQYADWMVSTLNRLGEGLNKARLAELQQLFNTGCRYEWLFWEMSWTMQDWPL